MDPHHTSTLIVGVGAFRCGCYIIPEALEVSMIHSVAGLLDGGRLLKRPPFREPHHGASQAALAGGGCTFSLKTRLTH